MPRRPKRMESANASPYQKEQQHQKQREKKDFEYAFQQIFLNTSQRCFLRGNGSGRYGNLESPYVKTNSKSSKSAVKGNCTPISSKSSQLTSLRTLKDPSQEFLNKTASSFDGWRLQKSKTSASKIRSEPVKPTVSPLARNRFYELRDKTPVRDGSKQLKKESKNDQRRRDLEWSQLQQNDILFPMPTTPGNSGKVQNKKPSHQLDTYLNVDGSRSLLSNRRGKPDPKPLLDAETLCFPEPPPCRQENSPKLKTEDVPHRYRRPILNENEKIAPLNNLATPVRDLWVTKPEHAEFSQVRCVRILPEHHQCAGPERYLTPNDVDTESLASKLEKHSRIQEPGSKAPQCICFRKTRRAYCTICKATIIGRAFRKCSMHPEVGFSTDHFYCPFCCAEPSALKDL